MKVRILSGAQKGAIVEMTQIEVEVNVASGFAELVPEMPVAVAAVARPSRAVEVPAAVADEEDPRRALKRRGLDRS